MRRLAILALLLTACGVERIYLPAPPLGDAKSIVYLTTDPIQAVALPASKPTFVWPETFDGERVAVEALLYREPLEELGLKAGLLEAPRFSAEGEWLSRRSHDNYRAIADRTGARAWAPSTEASAAANEFMYRVAADLPVEDGLVLHLFIHAGTTELPRIWSDFSTKRHDFDSRGCSLATAPVSIGDRPTARCLGHFDRQDVLGLSPESPRTVVAVAWVPQVGGCTIFEWSASGAPQLGFGALRDGQQRHFGVVTPSGFRRSVATFADRPYVHVVRTEALEGQPLDEGLDYRIDGTPLVLVGDALSLSPLDRAKDTRIGWGTVIGCDLRVARVLVYDRRLSDDEVEKLESALLAYYAAR